MSTYLDYYNENFAPALKSIDLFLKTESESTYVISVDVISELLDISQKEIQQIMENHQIEWIDKVTFFTLMQNGSSPICKLFAREVQRKLPHFYSFYDISYIYQIPYERIVEAASAANITNITNENMSLLFSKIQLKEPIASLS